MILSLGRRGGSVRYGASIIESMTSVSKEVFVSKFSRETHPSGAVQIPTYRNKFEFILSSMMILPFLWLYILIGLMCGKYKCLYTPYTHYWNVVFVLTFKLFNRKAVSTVHDGIPHTGDGNWWEKWINYATLKSSSQLIFLTEHVKNYLVSKVGLKSECTVIPHGLLEVNGAEVHDREFHSEVRVLFLGRVCHYKGVDLLLNAIPLMNQDRLGKVVIAGEVSESQKHLKETLLNVEWLDKWLSEEEMARELNLADILILPYREATQSGVITIGLQLELPIISTNLGGLIEQCEHDECVFVAAVPEAIANAFNELIEDEEKVKLLRIKMKEKKKDLTWDSISQKIVKCL